MALESIEFHSLVPDLIRPGGVVIDCGANLGAFSRIMVERFGCRVFPFEASPDVFALLPKLDGLTGINCAVCGVEGPVTLTVDGDITRTSMASGPKSSTTKAARKAGWAA